jgi:hypothetical protein
LMGSLNGDADQLVRAGSSALRATGTDRERIERALAARLGPHAFPPSPPVTSSARLLAVRAIAGAAVGACVIGGVFYASSAPPHAGIPVAVVPTTRHVANPSTVPLLTPTSAPTAGVTSPAEPMAPAEPASSSPASAPRHQDALTREVALLSRAVAALNAGRAGEALGTLNEHQRQFPRGVLGAERQAAKAQALCSLGRVREGRAELAHLPPKSPPAGRAKQVCESVAPAATTKPREGPIPRRSVP